jgi:endonuclease-8
MPDGDTIFRTARRLATGRSRAWGPDLLARISTARRRLPAMRERGATPIGEALVIQSAMAGMGNVYKSETLVLCRADPFAPVRAYSDEELPAVIDRARELLFSGLGDFPRRTRRSLADDSL